MQDAVIVVLENLDYSDVVGSSSAPYINSLIPQGGFGYELLRQRASLDRQLLHHDHRRSLQH